MKKRIQYLNKVRTWGLIFVLAEIVFFPVNAQTPDAAGAKRFAETFFKGNAPQFAPGKVAPTPVLEQRYQSDARKNTAVFAFQNAGGGFALVAQNSGKFALVGYAPKGDFSKENMPPQLQHLLSLYEDSLQIILSAPQKVIAGTPVMTPLLDEADIHLNQYGHEEVGGCPSGCVATAFAQIMAYYKYPSQGQGSHCYTSSKYGQICVDFGNTTYNWINPTDDDYKKLSYHVGVAMDMGYCSVFLTSSLLWGSATYGNKNNAMHVNFKYYVNGTTTTESYYVKNEIDHRRPVYIDVGGNPGHAMVLDGYDTDGLFHINFGWGGACNGYYVLNTGSRFNTGGYTFGTNIMTAIYISPTPAKTNVQDSLALAALHNAYNGTTGWDLSQPVNTWWGTTVYNGRVIELHLNNDNYFSYKGSIPPEIGNLTALQKLDLLGIIDGELPASIANMSELRELKIYAGAGNLKAALPENIGNLSKLEILEIPYHSDGNLPASLGNLTQLKVLNLTNGNLTGNIPAGIGNSPNLTTINLLKNKLSGPIPESISNLTRLSTLYLSENQLSGSLPANMGNMTELTELALNDNQLSGTLPESLGNCSKLKILNLYKNQFSGEIPASLGNLTLIKKLKLNDNRFSALPDKMDGWGNVEELDLNNNRLQSVPKSINNLVNLKTLGLSANQITTLPADFGFFPKLEYIDLSKNGLSVFPDAICLLPALQGIGFGNNKLTYFPHSIGLISSTVGGIYFENNDLQDSIPASLLTSGVYVNLANNRLRFENIPFVKDAKFGLDKQKPTLLSKKMFKTALGDTLKIDIRQIAPFMLPDNQYYWYSVNNNRSLTKESDPVLKLPVTENTVQDKYYCMVLNPNSPTWTYMNYPPNACLNSVVTDTLSLQLATDEELISEKYNGGYVVASKNIPAKIVEDRIVTLVPPLKVRGSIQWQASADGKTWYDLTETMTQTDLKANFVSVKQQELTLSPKTPAFYRCSVQDVNCEPLYSDTVKVNPFGKVLYDGTINTAAEAKTISVDSIEVTLPKGICDKDFRFTIVKLDNPPVAPAGAKMSSAYDVTVSFASTFDTPIEIKLKNIDKKTISDKKIPALKPGYYDEAARKWVMYESGGVVMKDSTVFFLTNHLTKLAWFELAHGSYTHIYTGSRVNVIYQWGTQTGEELQYQGYEMYYRQNKIPNEAWYDSNTDPDKGGTPLLVQDIAGYMDIIINKFESLGLQTPSLRFNVYVSNLGYDAPFGKINVFGYLAGRGYCKINSALATDRDELRRTLAHEYMHYTQDYYMTVMLDNAFFMEVHAPTAARLVWTPEELQKAEPQSLLEQSLEEKNEKGVIYRSIFDLLNEPWDNAGTAPIIEKFTVNSGEANISSAFLHYMQCYREGTKLDMAALLKNHGIFASVLTWRGYLNNQTMTQLGNNLGDEYDDYVRHLLSGEKKEFTVLGEEENPYIYLIKDSGKKNNERFTKDINYDFSRDKTTPKKNKVEIKIPYLASKALLLYNQTADRAVVVNYKRLHDVDAKHKVYYAKFNFKTKKTEYVDLTDSTTFNIFIEGRTDKSVKESKNICFLLFVNKETPAQMSYDSDFDASFELNGIPVLDIEAVHYAFLSFGKANSIPGICNYSNGAKYPFSMPSVGVQKGEYQVYQKIENYTFDRELINDSTYVLNVAFSDEKRIEYPDGALPIILKTNVTMHVIYNFVRGVMKMTGIENSKNYTETTYEEKPRIVLIEDRTTNCVLWVKNLNTMEILSSGKDVLFNTRNSLETQDAIERISNSISGTSYNFTDTSEPPKYFGYHYVSTDYSLGDILVMIGLKLR